MPRRAFEQLDNWAGGINTSANADMLVAGTSPLGLNTALVQISPNPPRALLAKRKGSAPVLETPLGTAIIGQYFFKRNDGIRQHLLIDGNGHFYRLNGMEPVLIDTDVFSNVDARPAFAPANELLFIANGTDALKYDGENVWSFGIERAEPPTDVQAEPGGNMTPGDYDIRLTYHNANTGHQSPVSDSVGVTVASDERIAVQWDAPSDPQVTHVRVWIRQRSRGPNFYNAVAGITPATDGNTGGIPVEFISVTLDITEVMFDAFRILAPEEVENQPPPEGAMSPTWHRSRMFVHDGKNIYWTDVEKPEAFNYVNNYEPVNPDDGDSIVGLLSAHDRLLVFKNRSTWALEGTSPTSWQLKQISPNIGAVNQASVRTHGGWSFWWDALKGPIAYNGIGAPTPIGIPDIGPTIDPELLARSELHHIVAEVDDAPSRQRIVWAIPELGAERNTLILPYNLMLRVWESSGWNPLDVASMTVAEDEDGTPWVYIGGYGGQLFQLWGATNDGVPGNATRRGRVVNTIADELLVVTNDEGHSPEWNTNELVELYAYAISQDGLDVQRRRITANDENSLTVAPPWGTPPNDTYTFVIGGIDFQADTPWMTTGAPFLKKRYEFLFAQVASPDSGVPVSIDVFFTYDMLNVVRAEHLELLGTVVYDSAIYDRDRYASAILDDKRLRMSTTGKAWRARVRNIYPDQELTLLKVAMQSVLLNSKS